MIIIMNKNNRQDVSQAVMTHTQTNTHTHTSS